MGNPTTYRGKAVEWQYGTRLTRFGETGFEYDGLGRRTVKNGITFTYDSDGRLLKQSNGLEFVYDNAGLAGIKHIGTQYFYRKDAQGNIVALLDSNGNVVVKYVYDAWGNNAVTDKDGNDISEVDEHIGNLNPFRYRGYYYDIETGMYYLQTRYYDPEVGRFISQDSIDYADPETINGLNLYAYCGNNPVMNIDPTGEFGLTFIFFSMLIGAVIGGVSAGVKASKDGLDAKGIALAVFGGVIMGAAVSGAFALGGAAVTGLTVLGHAVSATTLLTIATYGTAAAGIINYCATSAAYNKQINLNDALMSGVNGFFEGITAFSFGAFAGMRGLFKYADISLLKDSGYLLKKPIESILRFIGFSLPSLLIRKIFQQ